MAVKKNHLVWLDLEMTGLDPDNDRIIEIATLVTDTNLNTVAEGPVIAIHQDEALIDQMDEWNTKQHNKSGLVGRVLASSVTEAEAELETLDFLKKYVKAGRSPICGNSICQDRRFLYRCMPSLESFFHYRNLDVSTLKMLAQYWAPTIYQDLEKSSKHLAMDDIIDSIEELKYYRQHFINLNPGSK